LSLRVVGFFQPPRIAELLGGVVISQRAFDTLVLSVYERTREFGMLRAVGMSRRQARRMVRHESVVTALIGAGLGLPVGVILAAAVTHALSRFDVAFAVSIPSLAVFTLVAIGAGTLAAIAPARRASKINVLAALQYE
jgi:putative ABC transport system permease protein